MEDDISVQNIFSPGLTSASDHVGISNVSELQAQQQHLVHELVDEIFTASRGLYEASSSKCSSVDRPASNYSFDKRLLYWKRVLEERKLLSHVITKKTGKAQQEVLFNRPTTVEDRDKNTVKRVLDFADRMNPERLVTLQRDGLKPQLQYATCECGDALLATLPKPERDGAIKVEISGVPVVVQQEQMSHPPVDSTKKHGKWLSSCVLQQRVCEKREDIERVVEFYPDIENLQVVGESLNKRTSIKRDKEITIEEAPFPLISSDTHSSEPCAPNFQDITDELQLFDYGVRINDEVFTHLEKRSSKFVDLEVNFTCEPFECVCKRVVRIQNIGQKVLSFEFYQRGYFDKTPQLLKAFDSEFCFDHQPFRLINGEVRDICVQFQPRRVGVFKQKWVLKIDIQMFCRRTDAVVLRLSGKCKPPPEYVRAVENIPNTVVFKSNLSMVRNLSTGLSTLTPLLQPDEVICPYKRALNEKELFEIYNMGYKCERYHDLELLKNIYERANKPRHHPWDLKLETLKQIILRVEPADKRALLFSEMVFVLEDMKSCPADEITELSVQQPNPERDRARYLYVRGIIATSIDVWEETGYTLELSFLNSLLAEYIKKLQDEINEEEAEEEVGDHQNSFKQKLLAAEASNLLEDEEIRATLVKEVRHKKFFRDSLYMQTYSHLCDTIENIVSVIESTEII